MDPINTKRIETVASFLKGKRRENFLASIKVLNESLTQGAWVPRGKVKANSGFYQGLSKHAINAGNFELYMCFMYGQTRFDEEPSTVEMRKSLDAPLDVAVSWVRLCLDAKQWFKNLDAARPLPKVTAIGLSPKVTKTFQECGLDLDIASIKPAEIKFYEVQDTEIVSRGFGERATILKFDSAGKPVMKRVYYVAWTPGILFGKSRFANNDCQACGKTIPSCRYVGIEATCKKNGLVALWVGCDCASNIFGIKDIGIDKTVKGPTA